MQPRLWHLPTLAPALWLAAGCASAPAPTPAPSQAPAVSELVLAPGVAHQVGTLELTFEGVADDSRCPRGVQCIWAGDSKVLLTVRSASAAAARLELHTSQRYAREVIHAGSRLTLVRLTPEPGKGHSVAASDYRATLSISAATR